MTYGLPLSVGGGFGLDGVEDTAGINERGTGVHADGHAERFCDFFPSRARLEGGIRVKHDAAIATRGDRDGQREAGASSRRACWFSSWLR
jgi:hypothetical protein